MTATSGRERALCRLFGREGLDESSVSRALAALSGHRCSWADVFLQETRSRDWLLENGCVRTGSFTIDRGAGLRLVAGERSSLSYTNSLTPSALLRCAKTAASMSACGRSDVLPTLAERPFQPLYEPTDELDDALADGQIALLESVDHLAREMDPRVTDVLASYQTESDAVAVAAIDGRFLADCRPLAYLSITVTVESKGRREQATAGGGARTGIAFFTPERVKRWVRSAVDEALHNLEASPAPAGVMPVVLGPGWPGILLHEAIGHGLEGDFIRKGTSAFSDRMGQRIASPGVTVVDDGSLPMRRGSLSFDDEGTPSGRTLLIENGVLRGALLDMQNALLLGRKPTGNGRRESFASLPMPRMTNTFMLPGPYDPEEIISSVKHGIYAQNFQGGQVDITNGQFVFCMSKAWLIENGRRTRPIKGAMLAGSGAEALQHIPMVGHDLQLDDGIGQCGKDGQSVPVGVGMPTIRIDALTVGGSADSA